MMYRRLRDTIRRVEAAFRKAEAAADLQRLGAGPQRTRTIATVAVPGGRLLIRFIPDPPADR
jgi:hypothetical protein